VGGVHPGFGGATAGAGGDDDEGIVPLRFELRRDLRGRRRKEEEGGGRRKEEEGGKTTEE